MTLHSYDRGMQHARRFRKTTTENIPITRHGFNVIELFYAAARQWLDDNASRQAAAMSYYTVFSMAPVLILAISIAGLVFSQGDVQNYVVEQARDMVGTKGAESIETVMESTYGTGAGVLATLVAIATLFWGASNIFNQMKATLNHIWNVEPNPSGGGILRTVRDRVISIAMVLSIGFLLMVSLVVNALISAFVNFASGLSPALGGFIQVLNLGLTFAVITALFAMIYKFLPDAQIAWSDVGVGAAVTALLFVVGQFAIGLYLGNSSVASAYGAAGSLVVLLLWIYYAVQIFLFGAEFTQVYARRYGSHIVMPWQTRRKQQALERAAITHTPPIVAPVSDFESLRPPPPPPPQRAAWLGGFISAMAVVGSGILAGLLFLLRDSE